MGQEWDGEQEGGRRKRQRLTPETKNQNCAVTGRCRHRRRRRGGSDGAVGVVADVSLTGAQRKDERDARRRREMGRRKMRKDSLTDHLPTHLSPPPPAAESPLPDDFVGKRTTWQGVREID